MRVIPGCTPDMFNDLRLSQMVRASIHEGAIFNDASNIDGMSSAVTAPNLSSLDFGSPEDISLIDDDEEGGADFDDDDLDDDDLDDEELDDDEFDEEDFDEEELDDDDDDDDDDFADDDD
jgi:hypothetical protein